MSTGLTPNTREEMYLSAAAGETSTSDLPTPATRKEIYLNAIANNGGGGGGGFTPTTEQLAAMNSGITSEDVEQISTNENNISSEQAKTIGMGTGGSNYIQVNGIKMYFDTNAPTIASSGDVWITGTGSIKCKSENLLDFSAWADNVTVVRGTMTVNSDSVSITSTAATCFTGWNTTEYPEAARIAVSEGDVVQFTWSCDVDDNSNVWIFPNASASGAVSVSATTQFLQYSVPSGVNYITFRLDVTTADKTYTYSNLSITAWK